MPLLAVVALAGCRQQARQLETARQQPGAARLPEDVRRLAVGTVTGQTPADEQWARIAADLLQRRLAERVGEAARYELIAPAAAGQSDAIITASVHVSRQRASILAPAPPESDQARARSREVWTLAVRFTVSRPAGQTLLDRRLTDRHELSGDDRPADEPAPPAQVMLERCVSKFVRELLPVETTRRP